MDSIKLLQHQKEVLEATSSRNRVAYYLDMGLGKTFVGSEKATQLGKKILLVCQKSTISDWITHFNTYYDYVVLNLTKAKELEKFFKYHNHTVGVINYELVWRRPQLTNLYDYTLMLDESSYIQNHKTKQTRFICSLGENKDVNVILLSGTPCSGKYENLYSQAKLLGWDIKKTVYDNTFVRYNFLVNKKGDIVFNPVTRQPIKVVTGYKNVNTLKDMLREYGAVFMKTKDVYDLPEQTFTKNYIDSTKQYKTFIDKKIVTIDGEDFIGDSTFKRFLYSRMLCGSFNKEKLSKVNDLICSTNNRIVIFYNFKDELEKLIKICEKNNRPYSQVNGNCRDLNAYESEDDSITLCQYQAASRGLNLQLANVMIYFTPPVSVDHWMQSKKRIHRIGQNKACYYYQLICKDSIEEKIYCSLDSGVNYTTRLFEEDYK